MDWDTHAKPVFYNFSSAPATGFRYLVDRACFLLFFNLENIATYIISTRR